MFDIPNARPRCFWQRRLWIAALVVTSLAAGTAARAQSDPATPPVDPPARVGRISWISGPVTLTDYRANEESDASLNWPITSQQRLSTGEFGHAEVRIGSTGVWLDGDSVVDFNRIDDDAIQIALVHGSVAIGIRSREQLRDIDFFTPRERVVFEDAGVYRIDVDRTPGVSNVSAQPGTAHVLNGRLDFLVQSGQRGESTAEPTAFQLKPVTSDAFDDWVLARDRRDDSPQAAHYVSPETTGVESLDAYGDWRPVENYGEVWFPTTVVVGWAPYRYGRWAYIPPWGWTWIDSAPWGFTPFHFGRWVYVHNAWGWVPGTYAARPCYAPALVAWYGAPGVGAGVGWFPLAPGEAFIPAFGYSQRYLTAVNYGHVTTVINSQPNYRYRQPNFSTWAPSDALVRRTPINRVVQAAPNEWAKLPAMRQPPVRVTNDARRNRPDWVKAAPPAAPLTILPPRQIARRTEAQSQIEAPSRIPQGMERPDRDARGRNEPVRPPITRPAPAEDRLTPPVQRAPRSEAPRGVDFVAQPRAAKTPPVEPAAHFPRQIAAPAQQAAPHQPPRQDAPTHPIARRAERPAQPDGSIRKTSTQQRVQTAENAPRAKAP